MTFSLSVGIESRPLIGVQFRPPLGATEVVPVGEHALGEALTANAFVGLARYEVHLDRKLERTLTMLIRLQDLRRSSA